MTAVEYHPRPSVRRRDARLVALLVLFPLIIFGVAVGTRRHTSLASALLWAFGVPVLVSALVFGYQLVASRGDRLRIDGIGLTIRHRWRTRTVGWPDLDRVTVVPTGTGGQSLVGWPRPGVAVPAAGYRSGRRPPTVPGAVELYRIDALDHDPHEVYQQLARFAGSAWQPPA
jgi:hypothetical protein